jgi:hypothetical protein
MAVFAVTTLTFVFLNVWPPQDPVRQMASKLLALESGVREKICAHRNNNVPKYRLANELFHCLEIDVVVNPPTGGAASVYHPPHENNHGLTLEFLLSHENMPNGKLWLDVKDLSEDNWVTFLDQLMILIPPGRRGETIVETKWSGPSVASAAAAFRHAGFLFSYYLPSRDAIQCGTTRSQLCDDLRSFITLTVSMGFSHLSFDARAYTFVTTLRAELPPSVRLLTWDLSNSWPQSSLVREVDVYIVRFPSPFST